MKEFTYQDQVDRVLDYKKKILDSINELITLLDQYEKNIEVNDIKSLLESTKQDSQRKPLKNEIRKEVQKILSYLSSIGTFSNLDPKN